MTHASDNAIPARSAPARPQPAQDDPLYAEFNAGLQQEKVIIPFCSASNRTIWPPRDLCPHCHRKPDSSVEIEARGTIHSYAVCNRAFHPWFKLHIPYTIVIVELRPGVRMYGNLVSPANALRIGAPVRGVFSHLDDKATVLDWRLDTCERD